MYWLSVSSVIEKRLDIELWRREEKKSVQRIGNNKLEKHESVVKEVPKYLQNLTTLAHAGMKYWSSVQKWRTKNLSTLTPLYSGQVIQHATVCMKLCMIVRVKRKPLVGRTEGGE